MFVLASSSLLIWFMTPSNCARLELVAKLSRETRRETKAYDRPVKPPTVLAVLV